MNYQNTVLLLKTIMEIVILLLIILTTTSIKYKGHPESKEHLNIQSAQLFLLQPIIGFWYSVLC